MPDLNRCLALVTDAFDGKGGIAQYNRDFLTALAECGVVSSVDVLPRHRSETSDLPAGLRQLPHRGGRIGYAAVALYYAQAAGVRVIFCGHLYMAALAAVIARLTNAKLIVQLHGIEAWCRPSRLRRYAVETADLVLCVSRFTRAAVLGWAAIEPERVVVLPNTVAECFTPGDGRVLRAELGFDDHKRVLLTVGRLDIREQYKGHDRVIAALPQLIAQGHDVIYVVIGDGEDRARLEALAADAGMTGHVKFLGAVELPRLIEAYRTANLFVMPSTGEGFGIAFLEAMACGTPALGLNVAGAIDALADGELGTLTSEAEFPAAVAAALSRPKADRRSLANAVRARFGRAVFAAKLRAAVGPRVQAGC